MDTIQNPLISISFQWAALEAIVHSIKTHKSQKLELPRYSFFRWRAYYSFTSKLGALTPNFTPPDSVLAARTTTRLGDGALTLRRRELRSNRFGGENGENLRDEIANALREGSKHEAMYVTAVEVAIVVSDVSSILPEPRKHASVF